MQTEKHCYWIDLLRLFAILGVFVQHAATYYINGGGRDSVIANTYRSATSWDILIFIMISGVVFMGRKIEIGIMYKKYIRRILITFAFWSFLYTVYNNFFDIEYVGLPFIKRVKYSIGSLVNGGTRRMWYLVMLIVLYAIIPILQRCVSNLSLKEYIYLLILLAMFGSVLPSLQRIHSFNIVFEMDLNRSYMVISGYIIFYALFGYWIFNCNNIGFWGEKRTRVILYFLAIISLIICVLINYGTVELMDSNICFNIPITLSIFIISIGIDKRLSSKAKEKISVLADNVFGMYLVHTFFQYLFYHLGIEKALFSLNVHLGILLYCILLFIVCLLFVSLIRHFRFGRLVT